MTFKAYWAYYDGEGYGTVVHGETIAKAKYRFSRVDPARDYDKSRWIEIRLHRLSEWDNKPFVKGEEYNNLFSPDSYDEDGEGIYYGYNWVDCDCPLCKGAK
jgi:hypothetical protein